MNPKKPSFTTVLCAQSAVLQDAALELRNNARGLHAAASDLKEWARRVRAASQALVRKRPRS